MTYCCEILFSELKFVKSKHYVIFKFWVFTLCNIQIVATIEYYT